MIIMILGLVLFLGMHSVRIFADDWRKMQIARRGKNTWLALYALTSLVGLILVVWGYGMARGQVPILWIAPEWMKYVASLLIIPGVVLMVVADFSGTKIKATLGHPMVAGAKLWALGHLLTNGSLADVILFGGFLVWAILNFRNARRRDRAESVNYVFEGYGRDARAVAVGLVFSIIFIIYIHGWLIGVKPFP